MAAQVVLTPTGSQPTGQAVNMPSIDVPLNFNLQAVDARLQSVPAEQSSVESAIHKLNIRPVSKAVSAAPVLPEPLSFFQGTFKGPGFNMIFRPGSNKKMDTTFPNDPNGQNDNVLELNLTIDQIQFSDTLGAIPNRGLFTQDDISLSGVSYVQSVVDVTNPATGKADGTPKAIHFEPGLWLFTPATENPAITNGRIARLASIPHGTTIMLQGDAPVGTVSTAAVINTTNIKPNGSFDGNTFSSMNFGVTNGFRLPQDLTAFQTAGTITPEILADPTVVLRNANLGKTILSSTTFTVDSDAAKVSGATKGTASIDMLQPNALPIKVTATFYIQKVQYHLSIARGTAAGVKILPTNMATDSATMPSFVTTGSGTSEGRNVNVNTIQIQYVQTVQLSFNGLSWPHISVATLVRAQPIAIPLNPPTQMEA